MPIHIASALFDDVITASNTVGQRTLTVPHFKHLRINAPLTAELRVMPTTQNCQQLRLVGNDNIISELGAELRDETLHITLPGAYRGALNLQLSGILGPLDSVTVQGRARVIIDGLQAEHVQLTAHGSARLLAQGLVAHLQIECTGSSQCRIDCPRARTVRAHSSGSAAVELQGSAQQLLLEGAGASRIVAEAPAFRAEQLTIQLRGSARANVAAHKSAQGVVRRPARLRLDCPGTVAINGPFERA